MQTPKEYISNLKQSKLTIDMINDCLFSFNKRAKNCRDQKRAYAYDWKYHTGDKYEEKEKEYYKKKQEILDKLFKEPKCIHFQKISKRKRIYDYDKSYGKHKDKDIVWSNCYMDWHDCREVHFYDILVPNGKLYFLYYELGDRSYHTPIDEEIYKKEYKDYKIEELIDFETFGEDVNELLSAQFSNKIYDFIMSKDNIWEYIISQ